MGVDAIITQKMFEDGRLEQDGTSATIYIRDGLTENRRRFTIAHELGHRLLLHPRARAERFRRRVAGDDEERFCDDLAAAILLPRPWVQREFSGAPRSLKTVRRLSAMTSTSMSASLVRLAEVVRWPESLLRFRYVNDKWRLDAPAAVPVEIHGTIRTLPATTDLLVHVGSQTRSDTRSRLPISLSGHAIEVPAELSVNRSVAMALVNFRGLR
ncbi:MAG: ImmA/IrrE family metallo-endopeptidase [Actinomycetota bacterium]